MFYINCKDLKKTSTLAAADCKEKAEKLLHLFETEYPYILGAYWISRKPCKDNYLNETSFWCKNEIFDGYYISWPYANLKKDLLK